MPPPHPEKTAESTPTKTSTTWLPTRRFFAAVIAIAGMQLMATMDGTIAIVALPKIQNELSLSDAGRSWVITAYVLTFGGLMLLGGRLGDTIGRKRTFIVGVTLFTIASALCGIAWDDVTLVIARLLQGVGAAIAVADRLRAGRNHVRQGSRNAATAVFGAMTGVGSVMGLVVGGALTEMSWRLAFLVNVPIGLVMIYLARTALRETQPRADEARRPPPPPPFFAPQRCSPSRRDPRRAGSRSPRSARPGVALIAFIAFAFVERSAENPVVPFNLFFDRNRLATFAAIFMAGGVLFTVTVLVAIYVQDIMGYSALRAGVGFIPFAIAMGIGLGGSSQLVSRFQPRVVVIAGGALVVGAMIYGSTFNGSMPYFPNLIVPVVIAGIGIGMIVVPVALSAIAGVGFDQIGPTSAIALMLQNLGGPVVLAIIQAVITSRTLYLGGTNGPVEEHERRPVECP